MGFNVGFALLIGASPRFVPCLNLTRFTQRKKCQASYRHTVTVVHVNIVQTSVPEKACIADPRELKKARIVTSASTHEEDETREE